MLVGGNHIFTFFYLKSDSPVFFMIIPVLKTMPDKCGETARAWNVVFAYKNEIKNFKASTF